MRRIAALLPVFVALAACGERTDAPAAQPAAAPAPTAVAAPAAAPVLDEAMLKAVCAAGLSFIHGQTLAAMQVEGAQADGVTVSWRAPVDGGRRYADCKVQGDAILWRPARLAAGQTAAWSNAPTDPVVRFALRDGQIALTQTFPDGTTSQAMLPVSVQQKAAS